MNHVVKLGLGAVRGVTERGVESDVCLGSGRTRSDRLTRHSWWCTRCSLTTRWPSIAPVTVPVGERGESRVTVFLGSQNMPLLEAHECPLQAVKHSVQGGAGGGGLTMVFFT